jgi:hypothetical protein
VVDEHNKESEMRMKDVDIYWGRKGVSVVVRRVDEDGNLAPEALDTRGYQCSTGACCEWWKHAGLDHLLFVFLGIIRDGHTFEEAHRQFIKINEYKKFFNEGGMAPGRDAVYDMLMCRETPSRTIPHRRKSARKIQRRSSLWSLKT